MSHAVDEAQVNLRETRELFLESFGTDDVPKGEMGLSPLEVASSG